MLDALPADLQPVGGREVDRLREVEALVEPGMVGAGEGDDELTGVLIHSEREFFFLLMLPEMQYMYIL